MFYRSALFRFPLLKARKGTPRQKRTRGLRTSLAQTGAPKRNKNKIGWGVAPATAKAATPLVLKRARTPRPMGGVLKLLTAALLDDGHHL